MKRKLQLSLVDSKYNDSYPFNRNDRQTNLFVTEVLSESSKLLGSAPLPPPPPSSPSLAAPQPCGVCLYYNQIVLYILAFLSAQRWPLTSRKFFLQR